VKIIADLTKCHPGTHSETLARVLELAAQRTVHDGDIFVIVRADQSSARSDYPRLTNWREVAADRFHANLAVRSLLNELNATGANDPVLILSYDGVILGIVGEHGWPALQMTSMPFSALRRLAATNVDRSGEASVWPHQQLVELDTALATMKTVLEARKSTSIQSHVKATELRPAMALIDKRFAGKAILNGTAGLITKLIRIAESRGLIEVDRHVMPKTPLVWLKSQSPPISSASKPAEQTNNVGVPNAAFFGTGEAACANQLEASPLPPAVVPVGQTEPPSRTSGAAPVEHRSRKLEEALRSSGMGPFRDARLAMYDAIEAILVEVKLPTLDSLLSMAQAKAKAALLESGRETETKQQPWSKVTPFLRRILTGSGALLGEDEKPIAPGWLANLQRVLALAEKWRAKADSEIVLALISATDDVSDDDVSNLAGMLYHGRGDQERHQVIEAVAQLLQNGKAVEEAVQSRRFLRAVENGRGPASLKMA
jgi:hypothetical protein